MSAPPITRRTLLKSLGLGAAAFSSSHRLLRAAEPPPLRLAFIGAGGRGGAAIRGQVAHHYVAFADVDDMRAAEAYEAFPAVPRYRDYRRLLDRHAKEIDAVVISTPDHSHYAAGYACMAAGKHVYIEKPLAPTPWECRELARAAREHGVKAQLGIQGHSMEALRLLREWIDAGAAGEIHTVYLWTNRLNPQRHPWSDTLAPAEPVPASLSWDLWLTDRPDRPYNGIYHPAGWRNWWGFGTGAIGDIGVHMFDCLEFALDLGYPDLVEADVPAIGRYTSPPWSRVHWSFPARTARPAVEVRWFNGTREGQLYRPRDVPRIPQEAIDAIASGMALVGTQGTFLVPDMRVSSRAKLYPEAREREVLASRLPRTLPRLKGGHMEDWYNAIREDRQPGAHLDYGAIITEVALLGTFAQRTGQPIRWDPTTMTADGAPEVAAFVRPPGVAG